MASHGHIKTSSGHREKVKTTNRMARVYKMEKKGKPCRACGKAHHHKKCEVFSRWSTEKKWETSKRFGVCYHSLNDGHLGNQCPKSKACNVTGCKKTHHPQLHESQSQ